MQKSVKIIKDIQIKIHKKMGDEFVNHVNNQMLTEFS